MPDSEKGTSAPTTMERMLLEMMTAGEHPLLRILRTQVAAARVSRRETNGVGIFVDLEVPVDCPRLSMHPSGAIADVAGEVKGLERDVGFVLFVRYGALDVLEGFSYGEPWPPDASLVRCWYQRPERLDLRGCMPGPCAERDLGFALSGFGLDEPSQFAGVAAGKQTTIYVPLLGERVDCWRPVSATRLEGETCVILGPMPADEIWQFPPGARVRVADRKLEKGTFPVAIERLDAS